MKGKRKKHKKLPPLDLLHDLFHYDPTTGGIYKKGAEPLEHNVLGHWLKSGHRAMHVPGYGSYLVHRIVFYMFHRKDPGHFMVDHKNCDAADNRIDNLRRVRPRKNVMNVRTRARCVVEDGVSRVVGCV